MIFGWSRFKFNLKLSNSAAVDPGKQCHSSATGSAPRVREPRPPKPLYLCYRDYCLHNSVSGLKGDRSTTAVEHPHRGIVTGQILLTL